ncbi:MAG: InlB B-repeat-containing protein, partial [Oscillospiraceae bacterium]|nr:InlB B-repeat-containing protein [Oscillospiraceae bacterium]
VQPNAQVDITADTTVKAVWTDIPVTPTTSYTVTFDANGGSGSMSSMKVEQGQKLILTANGFTAPEGKQFKAWDVNGTEVQPNTPVEITADTTVKAVWEDIPAVTYTVTFDANGGSGSMDNMKAEQGKKLTLPANGFTAPEGQQFKAWDVNGAEYQPEAQVDITADTTVKAVWTDGPDTPDTPASAEGGCYVATAVYGSYDCPQVWTLRRFRDNVLAETWYGRLFIKAYYAVSPTCVKLFGDTEIFQNFFRGILDPWVAQLQEEGFESTPYNDIDW